MMKRKFFNKIFSFLPVIIACFVIFFYVAEQDNMEKIKAYLSAFVFTDEFNSEKLPFSTHNFDNLSDVEKMAYIAIFNNIDNHPKYIKIPTLTSDEFNCVYFAVKNDNPDILCFSDSCSMLTFAAASLLQFTYENDVDECKIKCEKLNKMADFIINEMPEYNDDYSKELYIHNYIVNNCSYKDEQSTSTAYSCLVDGVAVCSGYSRATMLLLKKAGIDSMLVAGVGKSASQGTVSHMWNIVWLDGEPYHLDVTWDDPVNDNMNIISHLYFNLTDAEISVDHSEYDLPFKCTVEKYNYFEYNNLKFDSYNSDTLDLLKLKLLNNVNNGRNYIEFMFKSEDEYLTAKSNLIENITSDSDIYNIFAYILQYANENIDKSHVNFTSDDNKNYIRMMFDNI